MSPSNWDIATIAGLLVALVPVLAGLRWLTRAARRVGHFLDDWTGEEARPGRDAREGVLQQLGTVRNEQIRIRAEVEYNGGGSLKDAMRRIETVQRLQKSELATLTQLLGAFIGKEQEARVTGHKATEQMWRAVETVAQSEPPEPPEHHDGPR